MDAILAMGKLNPRHLQIECLWLAQSFDWRFTIMKIIVVTNQRSLVSAKMHENGQKIDLSDFSHI